MVNGECLCGAVKFTIAGDLPGGTLCHCSQCRRLNGYAWPSVHIDETQLGVQQTDGLRWYAATPAARRGFCAQCGTTLFWDPADEDKLSVSLGALNAPTGARIAAHIFVGSKGDYYTIGDDLPQAETWDD